MKVTEIKNIPFLNLIPQEHRRWAGMVEEEPIELEPEEPTEEKELPAIEDGEIILYNRYGGIERLKKMARLINTI